ncbi:MAG TPA: FHA domain-containing protein [Kofleriaceae bacterium]|jgi:hypothetical protein|nr:FHA domain-containing protein [Kofleriaceae bacterium]
MRLATCVLGVALGVLAARPAVALADETASWSYRAVIDRVDLEPAAVGGLRLRIALSALALQGQLLDLTDPKSIRLMIGGGKVEAPYALGTYGATNADTAIVVVVEANVAYAEALPSILTSFDDGVLANLNDKTQLAVLSYGDGTGTGKLASLKTARGKLSGISPDTSTGDPALLDTLERAMQLLKKAKTSPEGRPLRKLIIAIGDGRDRSSDRERVTKLGLRAAKEGVRIHTFGYAPSKVLRSLLTLGELSKRSLGTFRWVRSGGTESWTPAFAQLRDEINKQYVLTYFLGNDANVAGKLKIVAVGRTEATSNEITIPTAACGGQACPNGYCNSGECVVPRAESGHGAFGWVLMIIGIGVGAVVVLGLVGFLMQRQRVPLPVSLSGQPLMPGQVPSQVPGMMPGQVPGMMPGQVPGRVSGMMPGQVPGPGMVPGQAAPGSVPPQVGSRPPQAVSKPPKSSWFKSKPPSQPPAVAPPPVAPVAGPALLVISGPLAGQRIALANGFTIGKAPGSNLVIDDGYASTQHAQVGMDQFGNCRLYDRNSTNGTFVNGVRITEVVLDHGMSVRIGSTELRFLAQ